MSLCGNCIAWPCDACAVISDGTAWCWGLNGSGQLGTGTTYTASTSPVTVTGLAGATAITAGVDFTCALIGDGTARCWGDNYNGQLGNGSVAQFGVPSPTTVSGLTGAIAISASGPTGQGAHACALIGDGTARCWGENGTGQLGDGTTSQRNAPVAVGLTGATAIDSGDRHTCALVSDGTARCWGHNLYGQLGTGATSFTDATSPVAVTGITGATAISATSTHSCALVGTGTARCWGYNASGQLGNGTTNPFSPSPVTVLGP